MGVFKDKFHSENRMFKTEENVFEITEKRLTNFIYRVNEGYVVSHTIYDLVNDHVYRKLSIKNGKVAGTPLGSRHILPGYWFTVYVAPQQSLKSVMDAIRNIKQIVKKTKEDVGAKAVEAIDKFKGDCGVDEIHNLLEEFQRNQEAMMHPLSELKVKDTFPQKNILKRLAESISAGNYEFREEDDLVCVFRDEDSLCDYHFEARFNVGEFTQFTIDFAKQTVELLRPIVRKHKKVKEAISSLLIGDIFMDN